MTKHQGLSRVCLAVALLTGWTGDFGVPQANAQEMKMSKGDVVLTEPPGVFDPAFAKFVNPRSLAPAIEKFDTTWLTDLAFQFDQAEGVLERQHKLFSAKEVAAIALAAAAETHDKEALDRLAKFAAKINDKNLAAKVQAAKAAANNAQTPLPPVMVAVDTIQPSTIAAYKEFIRVVRVEKILGNRPDIERRLAAFKKQPDMPKQLLDRGILVANEAVAAIPADAKMSSAANSLQQLLDYREYVRAQQRR